MTLTQHRDLWSGHPLWLSSPVPYIPYAQLEHDIKTEVLIVGAGVSGALMAEELTDNGFSVVMIDRRLPMHGSTMASTALLQYDIDKPLIKLSKAIGQDNAVRAWRRAKLGLENLAYKTQKLEIDCDLKKHDALYLAGDVLNKKALIKETDVRKDIGLSAQYLDANELSDRFGIMRDAALFSPNHYSANPKQFVAGYLQTAIERGAQIFAPEIVKEIKCHLRSVVVTTESNYRITARYVIFATGYELMKEIKIKNTKVHSSWAFATRPQPENIWPEQAHIWEASDPYLYIRATPDGRVLCGGEDEEFSNAEARDALMDQKIDTLQNKLGKLFPDLDTAPAYAWAGCFGETKTSLPMMGKVRSMRNCFAVLAFGGNGITFSCIAAEIISAMIQERKPPDADLFQIK